jgi:RNA polymerase sigma-70 factor (ECF subfamily)
MPNTEDGRLLALTAEGDQRALSSLYDKYAPAVTRYAWALAPDRHDVEEILQDTFVTLWRGAKRIDLIDASLLPWLLVTCRNHSMNLLRSRRRHQTVPLGEDLIDRGSSDAPEQLRWVIEEIGRLKPVDQRVCEMCLLEGQPYKEVAVVLGTSVGAVKQRVARSRARLRKVVIDDEA